VAGLNYYTSAKQKRTIAGEFPFYHHGKLTTTACRLQTYFLNSCVRRLSSSRVAQGASFDGVTGDLGECVLV
jgi:hypothetical protein